MGRILAFFGWPLEGAGGCIGRSQERILALLGPLLREG